MLLNRLNKGLTAVSRSFVVPWGAVSGPTARMSRKILDCTTIGAAPEAEMATWNRESGEMSTFRGEPDCANIVARYRTSCGMQGEHLVCPGPGFYFGDQKEGMNRKNVPSQRHLSEPTYSEKAPHDSCLFRPACKLDQSWPARDWANP